MRCPVGPGLMKMTTEDLWRESRFRANRIEPTDADGHNAYGIGHSMSTGRKVKGVGHVNRVTARVGNWSQNREIGGCSGWPKSADTPGNSELACGDRQLVDTGSLTSVHSSAVCSEHRSGHVRRPNKPANSTTSDGRGGAREPRRCVGAADRLGGPRVVGEGTTCPNVPIPLARTLISPPWGRRVRRRSSPGRLCSPPRTAGRKRQRRGGRQWSVGPHRPVRERRQLAHQHRQRLLRRTPVLRRDLARLRWFGLRGHRRPGVQVRADHRCQQGPARPGMGRVAGLFGTGRS